MNDSFKDRLAPQLVNVLKRCGGLDPILVAERLLIAIEVVYDMHHQEAGVAALPEDMRPEDPGPAAPWDFRKNRPDIPTLPPASQAVVQRPAKPSLIAMPGTPEFSETHSKIEIAEPTVLRATSLRRPVRPASNQPEVPYWDEATLIQEILKATPETMTIATEDREGHPRNIQVNRNVHNKAGLGSVELTYKHISVADHDGFLIAKHAFSVYRKDHNMAEALEDVRQQLAGQYRPRPEAMEPSSGPEPGPLRLDMKTQPGEFFEDNFQSGAGHIADPHGDVIRAVSRNNNAQAPTGHRF